MRRSSPPPREGTIAMAEIVLEIILGAATAALAGLLLDLSRKIVGALSG